MRGSRHDPSPQTADAAAAADALAHLLAHDLQGASHTLQMHVDLFLDDFGARLGGEAVEQLGLIRSTAKQIAALGHGLARYSDASHQPLCHDRIDLRELAEDLAADAAALEQGIEIHARPLPPVRGDRRLVRAMLLELIVNALTFNHSSPKRVDIGCDTPSAGRADADVCLRISDNGIGIPERHHASVFELFHRLHARHAYGEGAGAGLAVVRRVVERHGGRVWIESSGHHGCSVCLTLPADLDPPSAVTPLP